MATEESPAQVRQLMARGEMDHHTAGMCPEYLQANLVILPRDWAFDFLLFCLRNPKPCPLLEVLDPGRPHTRVIARGADVRRELPRYRVWRRGELVDEPTDITELWRDDLVSFFLGCSFTFDQALQAAGLPVRHLEEGRNVPMYRTTVPNVPAGRFGAELVVSMRPMPPELVERAVEISGEFGGAHGAPVHRGDPAAIGIAAFGPLDPDPASPTYGHITTTPKEGWAHTDFVGALRRHFDGPIAFDTDVNGAALGEWRWGAARGLDTFIYLTVGTGIGGGGMARGRLLHGLIHPEMGHIRLARDPQRDPFAGICPFHGDCLEGLASGPALEKRWGQKAETLPPDHPAWDLEADYLAQALHNFICVLSPQRIILGGGVMQQRHLFPRIRARVLASLNGYVQSPALLERIDEYIVPPALGSRAGVLGAIALGERVSR